MGRLSKTNEAKKYDLEIARLRVRKNHEFVEIRKQLEPYLKDHVLRVDQFIVFEASRVFTKTKKAEAWVKQIDQLNYNKSSFDALAKCLTIDDKFFWAGDVQKISCDAAHREQIIFRISVMKPKTLDDIHQQQLVDLGTIVGG